MKQLINRSFWRSTTTWLAGMLLTLLAALPVHAASVSATASQPLLEGLSQPLTGEIRSGAGAHPLPAAAGVLHSRGPTVPMVRPSASEWFTHNPTGLAHGFTLPPHSASNFLDQPSALRLRLAGDRMPEAAAAGQRLNLYSRSGAFAPVAQSLPQLAVSKHASPTIAQVGETITYTYRITNTGTVPLGIVAVDDQLGPVSFFLLPGGTALFPLQALQPGQAALGTRRYTVQAGDLPGPLVNTVTVTGTSSAQVITATAQARVALVEPSTPQTIAAQTKTMCFGDSITLNIDPQVNTAQTQYFSLVVISGPAPSDLLLTGLLQCVPYTGFRSMIELTNQMVTEGCATGVACNAISRIVFDPAGGYRIETIQALQVVTELFLPLLQQTCREDPLC
jgi:uncharacterized repeat protein (TIGR01451 family)